MSQKKVARSAISGRFVTKKHAAASPRTTVVETIKTPPPSKKK